MHSCLEVFDLQMDSDRTRCTPRVRGSLGCQTFGPMHFHISKLAKSQELNELGSCLKRECKTVALCMVLSRSSSSQTEQCSSCVAVVMMLLLFLVSLQLAFCKENETGCSVTIEKIEQHWKMGEQPCHHVFMHSKCVRYGCCH